MIPRGLQTTDYDRFLTLSEKAAHDAHLVANDAFVLAMQSAVRKGREKAKPGTYVDTSPAIGARRIYGVAASSACGSPAQMCMESGGASAGAESLK